MQGCSIAYYLIHSMAAVGSEYRERDRQLATAFGAAAKAAGVERIIYLGGLGETGQGLSEHLASRREVESALAQAGVPVTVFRAAMIIGSGSVSFEILRYLVERLPIMVTPRWVRTQSQPIAVRDVLYYLVTAVQTPETIGQTIDIGGPDVESYARIMEQMAEVIGLPRRLVIPVPILTPRLSSLWIHLITPLGARIARPLAEGLRNRVVCRDDKAQRLMPHQCLTIREAMTRAIEHARAGSVETAWSDAGVLPGDPPWAGGTEFNDTRSTNVDASITHAWTAVSGIGGSRGYYATNALWALRGFMDRLVGGPGLRRGRRNPDHLAVGDALDFWRVTALRPPQHLELRAEMKLPGVAWLIFNLHPLTDASTTITMTARFRPRGLFGILYWYSVLPLHGIVFRGMLAGLRKRAENTQRQASTH